MSHVDWKDTPPALRNPLLVYSFKGWNDAGEAASAAVGLLIANLEGRLVAAIDPEDFFDFTQVRPTIRLTDGMTRVVEWPAITVHVAQVPGPTATWCFCRARSLRCAGAPSVKR